MKHFWTVDENNLIKTLWDKGLKDKEIHNYFPNLSLTAVKGQRYRLNKSNYKHLTTEEINKLIELYPTTSYNELSKYFGISTAAIQYQLKKHLIKQKRIIYLHNDDLIDIKYFFKQGYRICDIAKIYGITESAILTYCHKLGFNPTDVYYTKEMKVRHKIKQNAGLIALYNNYKNNAKRFNKTFNLTLEEFKDLTSSNCHYCNIEPHKIKKSVSGMSDYKFNGIDKKDPNGHYIKDNCVSCCWECNQLKTDYTYEEFYQLIEKLYLINQQRLKK